MKIEELMKLATRINMLDDLLTKLEKNDRFYVSFRNELDSEFSNIFVEDPDYKSKIFTEINTEFEKLVKIYHKVDDALKKLDTSAEEVLNKYGDSQQNNKFIEEALPAYKANKVITIAFIDKMGMQQNYTLRYEESNVQELIDLIKKFNDDNEKFIEYNMLKMSEEANLESGDGDGISVVEDESDEYLDEADPSTV